MACIICKKTKEEAELFKGIYEDEIIDVCGNCAELEEIPLMKKPTQEQLQKADKKYSVRERMEKIAGIDKKMPLTKEQLAAGKNLKNLKFPEKKQEHEKLVKNYYWVIRMARRREKLSFNQLSMQVGITPEILEAMEHGQLPENFEQIAKQLELNLGIKLLKDKSKIINFTFPLKSKQQEILEKVKEKMELEKKSEENSEKKSEENLCLRRSERTNSNHAVICLENQTKEKKKEMIKNIASGKFDFSKRQNLSNLTINDLVDMKKKKQKKEMFGDDLDLEAEEV